MISQAEEANRLLARARNQPPYQFIHWYADFALLGSIPVRQEQQAFMEDLGRVVKLACNADASNYLRLVEVDADLLPLIIHTDNKFFYRPLFFPKVFINCDFSFEDYTIKGLFITDMAQQPLRDLRTGLVVPPTNDWTIIAVATLNEELAEYFTCITLVEDVIEHDFIPKKEQRRYKKFNNFVRRIAVNIVDLIEESPDIRVTETVITKEHNEKRIKRGQLALPTKIYIRASEPLKKYAQSFAQKERSGISVKFLVRGFYKHFRDKHRYAQLYEDYDHDRLKERTVKRGDLNVPLAYSKEGDVLRVWVFPFWKGEGIIVKKAYKVE